jgi:hypothetical protein
MKNYALPTRRTGNQTTMSIAIGEIERICVEVSVFDIVLKPQSSDHPASSSELANPFVTCS